MIGGIGRPSALNRIATCARRVGDHIVVAVLRSEQAVVVVDHRDVTSARSAQVNCAVGINVNRDILRAGQVNARLDAVHHHDCLRAGRRAVVAAGVHGIRRPSTLDRVAPGARRIGHIINITR